MAPRRAPCRCRALEPEPAPRSSLHACLSALILHVCVHDSVYQRNNIVRSAYHTVCVRCTVSLSVTRHLSNELYEGCEPGRHTHITQVYVCK